VGVWRLARIAAAAWLLCWPVPSEAQTVELTPFYGYRFGGEFFEIASGQPVNLDDTKAFGGLVNVKFTRGDCFVAFNADVVWQGEFSVGLVVAIW
jgi:hypothetical protein